MNIKLTEKEREYLEAILHCELLFGTDRRSEEYFEVLRNIKSKLKR